MKQKIWYCTEDGFIFPNEVSAREGYKQWLRKNTCEEDFEEDIFRKCYKEITFAEYNKEWCNED